MNKVLKKYKMIIRYNKCKKYNKLIITNRLFDKGLIIKLFKYN